MVQTQPWHFWNRGRGLRVFYDFISPFAHCRVAVALDRNNVAEVLNGHVMSIPSTSRRHASYLKNHGDHVDPKRGF